MTYVENRMTVFKLPIIEKNIELNDKNIILNSITINEPKINLGFQFFFNKVKNLYHNNKQNSLPKNYYILNDFETDIPNYEDNLTKVTKFYINNKKEITYSHDFYIMWEMLFLFELDKPKSISLSINDYNNELTDAYYYHKKKFIDDTVTIYGYCKDKIKTPNNNYKIYSNNFNDIYSDIKTNKNYPDLILVNSNSLKEYDILYEEQYNYDIIFEQIIFVLQTQNKNGNVVFKIYDSYTIPTIKMIYILSSFYKDNYIYKPNYSKKSNSEKYVICKNFKYDQIKDNIMLTKYSNILKKCFSCFDNKLYVNDIFLDLIIPKDLLSIIKYINIKMSTQQQLLLNKIIKFINSDIKYGDEFHTHKEKQIKNTTWWVNTYFPPSKNLYEKNKENIKYIFNTAVERFKLEYITYITPFISN